MKENNEIELAEMKPVYDPVTVQVNEVVPMCILCASGGVKYNGFGSEQSI